MSARPSSRSALLLGVIALACVLVFAWRALETPADVVRPPERVARTSASGGTELPPDRGATLTAPPHTGASIAAPGDLGGGAGVFGLVSDVRGKPVHAADLEFRLERDGRTTPLGSTHTAEDGGFAVPLDADVLLGTDAPAGSTAWILIDAHARGFQPVHERRALADLLARAKQAAAKDPAHAGSAAAVRCDIEIVPGLALRGRTVDSTGRPVPRADVRLIVSGERGEKEVPVVAARVETDAGGRFELGFASEGRYELAVRAENVGTARRNDLSLAASGDVDLGDVVLRGTGRLAGATVHRDGSLAAEFELWAVPADVDPKSVTVVATRKLADREGDDGLVSQRVKSDREGRFSFQGLKPGRYALLAASPRSALAPRSVLVSAPDLDLRLVVADARLALRVVDTHGAPVTSARVSCARLERSGDGEGTASDVRWAIAAGAEARAWFDVEPDSTYVVRAVLGTRSVEDVVHVAPAELESERTLVLSDDGASGQLRLVLTGPSGEPVHRFRVDFLSAVSDERIEALAGREPDANGVLRDVPPGSYRIEIVALDETGSPRAWLPLAPREPIEVRARATSDLGLRFLAGSTLRLAIDLEGPLPADFAFRPDPRTRPHELERARADRDRAHAATARLSRAGGGDLALQFEVPATRAGAPPTIASGLTPGDGARVHGSILPGEYTLHVEAHGFAPVEQVVTLGAGEDRTLRVVLRAQ